MKKRPLSYCSHCSLSSVWFYLPAAPRKIFLPTHPQNIVRKSMELKYLQQIKPRRSLVLESAGAPGDIVYDLGFTPAANGFSFSNYGNDIPAINLTATELRRMFGDQVCARLEGDECTLTPPAEQWMEQVNGAMSGGHCEGMAVLSLMMYTEQVSPQDFGGTTASDLDINDETLQREIAYWWTTQTVAPTYTNVIKGTPMEILELVQQMDASGETYTIGIYKEDGSGGHAITPFGVEVKEDGLYAILVYDNNYPGETRELLVDSRDNTWLYEASINPRFNPSFTRATPRLKPST